MVALQHGVKWLNTQPVGSGEHPSCHSGTSNKGGSPVAFSLIEVSPGAWSVPQNQLPMLRVPVRPSRQEVTSLKQWKTVASERLGTTHQNRRVVVGDLFSAQIKEALRKNNLPVRADGVRIVVLAAAQETDFHRGHAADVAHMIAGRYGLATGCRLYIRPYPRNPSRPSATFGGLAESILKHALWRLDRETDALNDVVQRLPASDQTSVITTSQGFTLAGKCADTAALVLSSGQVDLYRGAMAVLGRDHVCAHKITSYLYQEVLKLAGKEPHATRVQAAKKRHGDAMKRAREANYVMVAAAGNDHDNAVEVGSGAKIDRLVGDGENWILVTAMSVAKGSKLTLPHFASPGHVSTLGSGLQSVNGVAIEGTSFAAPYMAGAIALMIAANPRFKPARIGALLRDPRFFSEDCNQDPRDGMGIANIPMLVYTAKKSAE